MGISSHRLPHVATRCQAVVRREGGFHRLATGGYGLNLSHPLPSGGAARGEASTVWRQLATGYGGDGLNRSHPLPSGGAARGEATTVWRQVATGYGGAGLNRSHPLPSGGGARGRLPPSGDRWLRVTVAMATNVG